MTKLEAVNEILQRCGQLPASGLATGTPARAGQAERVLDRVDRQIQLREWHFNRRRDVTVTAALVDGVAKFAVPANALNIRPENSESMKFAEVGGFLYDVENNAAAFAVGDTVVVRYAERITFESIPQAIAEYIAARAAAFFNQEYIKDNFRIADLAASERSAKARAMQADIASAGHNILTTPEAVALKGDRLSIPSSQ